MIKQMAMVNFSMPMVIYMRENGSMIRLTERECTPMQTVLSTMEIGLMTNNMEREWNNGQMELSMKENTAKEKRTAKGN